MNSEWIPVVGELASIALQIFGPILVILISAVVWKLLGKIGVDKNMAMDALLRSYIKSAINYADSWADKQSEKPAGEDKMKMAIVHVLDLIDNSKLPKVTEEKLRKLIESQLSYNKK